MNLKVNEIFATIQGEGSWTGTPATFIRLSKCNLSCTWCDTEFETFTSMSLSEIMKKVLAMPARHIVVTGGEPTLQLGTLLHLVHDLKVAGFKVALETNGTTKFDISKFDHVTMSPKENVPMAKKNQERNRSIRLFKCNDLKIVDDYHVTDDVLDTWLETVEADNYFLQPLSNEKESVDRCSGFVQNQEIWRLSLQTHKMIGLP